MLQATWLLVLPAFAGVDEFDHVYRAAAVAQGQWVAEPSTATRGTGAWLDVPRHIVEAAREQCSILPYTTEADCVGQPSGDSVRIASGAGRYHPLYYALVGYPALPFHGAAAVYVMRVISLLLCTGMIGAGLLVLRTWTRRWTYTCAIAALTPILVYSTAVVAPNGLEMAAAFSFWISCVAMLRGSIKPPLFVLSTGAVSGVLLVTLRSLGPLWCLAIFVTAAVATGAGPRRLWQHLTHLRVRVAAMTVFLATIASVAWILTMGSLTISVSDPPSMTMAEKVHYFAGQTVLWILQSISAMPTRGNRAPLLTYACYLVLALALVALALWRSNAQQRRGIWVCLIISTALPLGIVWATMNDFFGTWQGRYVLPYSLGAFILAGLVDGPRRIPRGYLALAAGLYTTASVLAIVQVRRLEIELTPSLQDGTAWIPGPQLIVVITTVACMLLWSVAMVGKGERIVADSSRG